MKMKWGSGSFTAVASGEGEEAPGKSADGTKGDLMVSGCNQEVQRAEMDARGTCARVETSLL